MEHIREDHDRVKLLDLDLSANAANYFLDDSILPIQEKDACDIIRNTAIEVAMHEKFTAIWANKIKTDHSNLNWAINRTDRARRTSVEESSRSRSVSPVKQSNASKSSARSRGSRSAHSKSYAVTEMCKSPTIVTDTNNLLRLWDFEDLYYLTCAKIRAHYDDIKLRLAHFDGLSHAILHTRGASCNSTNEPFTYLDMATFLTTKWSTLQAPSLMHTLDKQIRINRLNNAKRALTSPSYDPNDANAITTDHLKARLALRLHPHTLPELLATPGLQHTNALPAGGIAALLWDKNEATLDRERAAEAAWAAARRRAEDTLLRREGAHQPALPCACAGDGACPCAALCAARPWEDCLCRTCPAFTAQEVAVPVVPPKGGGRGAGVALVILEGFGWEVEWEEEEEEKGGKWWRRGWRKVRGWMGR